MHTPTCSPTAGPYVPQVNLFHIFDWRWIQFHSFITWMEVLTFVLAAPLNALYLRYVVSRRGLRRAWLPGGGGGGRRGEVVPRRLHGAARRSTLLLSRHFGPHARGAWNAQMAGGGPLP